MLYPYFTFFGLWKMHGNAYKQRAECAFEGVENFEGAISGGQKIWISGGVCCIFAYGEVRLHLSLTDEKTIFLIDSFSVL